MATIRIGGEIVSDDDAWLYDWYGIENFHPSQMREALEALPEGEELDVEINSVGGSVFAGFDIYSQLRGAAALTRAKVTALAASAASYIMTACDEVQLSPVAQVMIHQPATYTEGNISDHEHTTAVLRSLEESILNAYELKAGRKTNRTRLRELMDAETWLTAQEAVELGLADSILYGGNGLSAAYANGVALHDPAELRAKYEAQTAAEAVCEADEEPAEAQGAPAEPESDWMLEALREIRQERDRG